MKNERSKIPYSVAAILLLTSSALLAGLGTANAHTPPLTIPTWTYIAPAPPNLGLGQDVLIVFWCNEIPATAQGAYGDRFTFTIEITKPDGTKELNGPITSDPVGGGYLMYHPTSLGTYTIVAKMAERRLTGLPIPPGQTINTIRNAIYVNDTFLGSTSEPATFTVTQQQVPKYEEAPLPTGYWTRPINGANRNWAAVAGNWLGGAAMTQGPTNNVNPYSTGPESAHVLWTRPYWDGGIMDGRFGDYQYYTGLSYEGFGGPTTVLNGRVYYNVMNPPRFGWYAVDLYSGETLYFQNTTYPLTDTTPSGNFDNSGGLEGGRLSFGQIYNYESPNQHGGFPYLWSTSASTPNTWTMYDGFTGNLICRIANVSASGTSVYGKDGSILRYNIVGTGANKRLTVWNTSQAIWYEPVFETNEYWMWRPDFNKTFDGRNGFSLNVSIPNVQGSIRTVRENQFAIGGIAGQNDERGLVRGNLWALSLKQGEEGRLLWNITFAPPKQAAPSTTVQSRGFVSMGTIDPEDGVFLFEEGITRKRWVYSLTTGNLLWESQPEPQFNYYGVSSAIYNGKLLAYGYSGILIAYEITTGKILYNWTAPSEGYQESFYPYSPLSLGCIADGKIYLYSTEHSPSVPLRRDANIWCVDTETGKMLWKMQAWVSGAVIADGRLLFVNLFDNQLYCYGKGPSATTVTASPEVIENGRSVMIRGTVTDQTNSPEAKGTPAIADEDQEAWNEYLYQQRPCPTNAKGVPVKITAIDPNGNFQDIGTATSDASGNFGIAWTPPVPGTYRVTATFAGSKSYGGSLATTYFAVDRAAAPAVVTPTPTVTQTPPQPTPATPTPIQTPASPSPTQAVTPPTSAEPTATYIAIGIAIVIIVAVAAALVLKRRK